MDPLTLIELIDNLLVTLTQPRPLLGNPQWDAALADASAPPRLVEDEPRDQHPLG